jgi:hypothetical protein
VFPAQLQGLTIYPDGGTVPLSAGRWDATSQTFLTGQGSVTAANFYTTPFQDFASAPDFFSAPRTLLGAGTFDSANSLWELTWDTTTFTNSSGYVLQVDFIDPTISGVNTGVDDSIPESFFVPEPPSLALFGISVLGLLGYAWHRRKRAAA